MSTTEKQDLILGVRARARGRAGHNSKPLCIHLSLSERSDGGAGDLNFLASQDVSRALWEKEGGQEAGQPTVEDNWDVQFIEGEEEVEEDQDENYDDWNNDEDEESEDNECEEEKSELDDGKDKKDDMELDKEEDEKDRDDAREEGSGNNEEEEEDYEPEFSNIREVPMLQFRSVFWGLIHSILYRAHYNDHDLAQHHGGRKVVRRHSGLPLRGESSIPQELEESNEEPVPQEQGDLKEVPVFQEQEDLKKEANVWEGEDPAEGTSWMFQKPIEGAIYQKAEEEAAEFHAQKYKSLIDASKSWEAGTCASDGAGTSAYGKWLPSLDTLAVPGGISSSKEAHTQHLPLAVKRRVNALKRLQAQYAKIEAQFYKDLYDLEKRYAAFYQPLFSKRFEIINAIYEPTEDECQWEVVAQEGAGCVKEREPEGKEQTTGIPHFWLRAFKNVKILAGLIQRKDELILEHLKDVKIKYSRIETIMGFTIEFIFTTNEYFFNEVLTKTYRMKSGPDDYDPFFSKGPEIINSTGCEIYWKEGKDITVKSIKLQKYESHGVVSTIVNLPRKSFFTYFYSPYTSKGRVLDVSIDYKLGYFFREVLVPKSVLFYIKEKCEYKHGKSDDEAQEARDKEERKEGLRNEEPEKDLGPENSSL
ncbi:Nucleosome assembly protein 1-like 1 [Galemys pyrenaicus]|uniref:Nucleosome assembly protein 1-like 1 n=1 Tax=Galemys pyrenaicus TaxID=202257 RepID=A0A8J6DH66_GALPY|nr:Nucleosome assembly protein 1-like 1 [Galemys pyrenaicus]